MQDQEKQSRPSSFDMKMHLKRNENAWVERVVWDGIYEQAYHWVMPNRRPASRGRSSPDAFRHLYSSTGLSSARSFAGRLHRDLFPSDFFKLMPSKWMMLAKQFEKQELDAIKLELEEIELLAKQFFDNPEFDQTTHETCLDCVIGTGALMVARGDRSKPVRFVNLPIDEIAIELGPYNDIVGIFWKTKLTYRQIHAAFPQGDFDDAFRKGLQSKPEEQLDIHQDFVMEKRGGKTSWRMIAHLARKDQSPIAQKIFRVCPIAILRFSRTPGEPYGRGPVMDALPSIITENTAMEMMLTSAAFQMLGLWGYRKGGAFNPESVRLEPGAFLPMSHTGGVMGPDIVKMDPGGRIDVAELASDKIREQILAILHDESSPARGKTPVSATEMSTHVNRTADNYMGSVLRLSQEAGPVLVRAVLEVMFEEGLIDSAIPIDDLLVKVEVTSPVAMEKKARAQTALVEFMQLVQAFRGPQGAEMLIKVDEVLERVGAVMGFPIDLIYTQEERDQIKQNMMETMQAAAQAQQAAQGQPQGAMPDQTQQPAMNVVAT